MKINIAFPGTLLRNVAAFQDCSVALPPLRSIPKA